MEVGWYLRFARSDRVEALVTAKTAPQVQHQEHIFPDWAFAYREDGDDTLAIITRRKPVYDKE